VAGDVDAVKKLCAAGLVNANEIIPSSGGTAIYEAIRLDQQAVLTALLAGAPCPEMPSRLTSGSHPDYFAYAASMHKLYLKKRKPRSLESSDILLQSGGLAEKPTKSAAFASGVELLSSAAITLVPVGELLTRYSLFRLNEYSSCRDEDPQPLIAVCEANLTLADLDLDYPEDFSGEEPVGFLIVGDLTVTGNISNEDTDGARSLVVLGDLHAGNIAVGGQELYVRGNVVVDGVYCGYYNHGESFVDGDVAARLLIADDYSFHIGGETHAPLADREGGDIPIHFVLAEECLDDDEWPFNFYVLIERLRDGLPVLHPDCFEGSPKLAAWRKAISRYKQALCYYEDDEPQKAIPLLTWCIDNNIYLGECLAKRASSQMIRLDQDDEADAEAAYAATRADCERVIEAKGFGSGKWLAEALNIFGYSLYHADSYEEALEPLTRSLEIDSGQFNANSNVGKCLWHLDRCDEALPYLDKAIGIDSDESYPYLIKAHCHYELEDYETAAETFADYLERDPESEGAREQFIRSLIALDRVTDAQAQAFELFERHPDNEFVNADGFMADALLGVGRSEEALKHAILSVKADPKPGYHFYVKGLCHDFMKDRNNARTAWLAYAEVAPNDLPVLNRLAISFMTKDPKAALRYIDRALAIDPEDESSLMTREMIDLM
jgi:tetratricopeptide (TPR) repeat protein